MQRRAFIRLPGGAAASLVTPEQRRGDRINRRTFLALGAGAAAVPLLRPRAARAQQGALPVIGYIGSSSAEVNVKRVAAFRKGLAATGFVEGRNVAIEYRWSDGQYDRLVELAADLVRRKVSVIVTPGADILPSAILKERCQTLPSPEISPPARL